MKSRWPIIFTIGLLWPLAISIATAQRKPKPKKERTSQSASVQSSSSSAPSASLSTNNHPVGSSSDAAASSSSALLPLPTTSSSQEIADAGAPLADPTSSTSAPLGEVYSSCIEHLPQGAQKPNIQEEFPSKGLAGYALNLVITIEHGRAEIVLPHGFSLQHTGREAEALTKSGFIIASADGGISPKIEVSPGKEKTSTKVTLPIVALPNETGRQFMTLPSLPIAIARASGEIITICTKPHPVIIEDPTSNTPDAVPKPNPEPRRQREEWVALRRFVEALAIAMVAAILGAIAYRAYKRRPVEAPPPPPPRPPWEIALEALEALRKSDLLAKNKNKDYVDQVSDIVRRYLGDLYGFDGLEATSREVRKAIRNITPPIVVLGEIDRLLDESDLIKFAGVAPSSRDCETLCHLGELIVRATAAQMSAERTVHAASSTSTSATEEDDDEDDDDEDDDPKQTKQGSKP